MILLILLITLSIILIFLLQRKKISKTLVPPGPTGLPLIRNLHQIGTTSEPHVYLWQLSKKYGPIIHMKFASVPVLVVCSAKSAKQVLKTLDTAFCGRPKSIAQRKISYNCMDMVFSPCNDYWREVRKITNNHLFSLKKVQSFRPIREDEISRMIQKISSLTSSSCRAVNLSEILMGFSISVICRIAFGKRYDERRSEMRRFGELTKRAQVMLGSFYVSDYFPALSWVDKMTGLMSRLDSIFKDLDCFYQEVIDEHVDGNRKKETYVEGEDDIIDVLIRLKQDKSCSIGLEWDHIKALLTDIFIAGTDTTAATVVWAMTALMKAPNVMKKLQAEIRKVTGAKGKVEENDLQKLPYLKAVICETLRLYPPAPLLVPRETVEKTILDGFQIEPQTLVYVNAWAVARDPECWDDPDEFLPERFLNSDIDIKGQDFGVIPFGSGRRICPGMTMGLANVELTTANLVYCFDWEMPPGIHAQDIDLDCLPGVTMHKKNALYLVPKKYNIVLE